MVGGGGGGAGGGGGGGERAPLLRKIITETFVVSSPCL